MRRAIETYKECYNLAEQYGYSNLQFDVEKISDLSKVVNQRVQMLNLKAAWNNPDDMTTLISLAGFQIVCLPISLSPRKIRLLALVLQVQAQLPYRVPTYPSSPQNNSRICGLTATLHDEKMTLTIMRSQKTTLSLTEGHSGQRGGAQFMNFVNEPGLYRLIFASRKPEAKNFQRWVYHHQVHEELRLHLPIREHDKHRQPRTKFHRRA